MVRKFPSYQEREVQTLYAHPKWQLVILEVWVRTDTEVFIPIHKIAASFDKERCQLLPYFHAFSGKDHTSFIYGLGKKKMWKSLSNIDTKPFQVFAETQDMDQVPTELIESSKALVVRASGGKETDSLASLRTQQFLAGKSGLLLNLPPTEDALEQHIKRAALATIITKSFQHQRTLIIDFASFGWILQDKGKVNPIIVTRKALPPNLKNCCQMQVQKTLCRKLCMQ